MTGGRFPLTQKLGSTVAIAAVAAAKVEGGDLATAAAMRAMGATPTFAGKPPAQAHGTLPPILTGHFDRRLRILEATLHDHGLDSADIRTWVEFENAFRDGIVK